MVEPLDREPVEIEMGGHAAGDLVGLEDRDLVPGLEGVVGGRQPHGARSDDGDTRQDQNSRTTLE